MFQAGTASIRIEPASTGPYAIYLYDNTRRILGYGSSGWVEFGRDSLCCYGITVIFFPSYWMVLSTVAVNPSPWPCPSETNTTLNVRVCAMPGKEPTRAPMVRVRPESSQEKGMIA